MFELEHLRQFLAFCDAGTLIEASEKIHVSQPVLSRTMKQLEEEIGVALFSRQKNRLELNDTGRLAESLARGVMERAEEMRMTLLEHSRRNTTISIASCAPAPLWRITPILLNVFPEMTLKTEIYKDSSAIMAELESENALLGITISPMDSKEYISVPCEEEQLMFALPLNHRFSKRKSLSFNDMDGERMLVFSGIGFWEKVHRENMPNSIFMMQDDRENFVHLVDNSSFAAFTTNLVSKYQWIANYTGRTAIPIKDKSAHVTYYLIYHRKNIKKFDQIYKILNQSNIYHMSRQQNIQRNLD